MENLLVVVLLHYAKQRINLVLDLDPVASEKLSGFISAITRMQRQSLGDSASAVCPASVADWPWTH